MGAMIVAGGKGRRFEAMGIDTHGIRAMLLARAQLVTHKVKLTNCIDARHAKAALPLQITDDRAL
jgi:hypothetical protein